MSDYKVTKTDAQWRTELEPMQYEVARHAATERFCIDSAAIHFAPK